MLLTGYIDESGDDKVFTLSCVMTTPSHWTHMQSRWKAVLRDTNKSLRRQGRREISRFHSADCSSLKGEFAGWSVAEQVKLAKDLIAILKYNFGTVMAFSVPIKDFIEVFPEHASNAKCEMYGLMLRFMLNQLMVDIRSQTTGKLKPYHIALIHDHCACDGALLESFNTMKDDPTFEGREHFTTIAAMSWEHCIPLQAADLVAYETFKDAANQMQQNPRPRRKALDSLLQPNNLFGGHSLSFNRRALEKLREEIKAARTARLANPATASGEA